MGNAQNGKKRKLKHHNTLKEKIDKEIMESLGSKDNKESVNRFKDGMKRRLRAQRFLTSGLGKILNDEDRSISTAHNLLSSIFDSNVNFEEHKELINNNFINSHFLYNIIEEKNSKNSKNSEFFYKEKIESLGNLLTQKISYKNNEEMILTKSLEIVNKESVKFSDVTSENQTSNSNFYINQNNSLRLSNKNILRETLGNNPESAAVSELLPSQSLRTSQNIQTLRSCESINKLSNKINFQNDKILLSQGDVPVDTPEQFKITEKLENSNFNLTSGNKSEIKTMNINLNPPNQKQTFENILSTSTTHKSEILSLEKSYKLEDNTASKLNKGKDRSISKTKKRIYTKPPVVNIKINLKDFIKQDAIEKSFLTPTTGKNTQFKKNISKDLNITNFSKDQNISNVNDSSFVDIVDALSDTKKEYIEMRKRKNLSKSKSKSPHHTGINFNGVVSGMREFVKIRTNDEESFNNSNYNFSSYYQESRENRENSKNRIKYKQTGLKEKQISDGESDDSNHLANFGMQNRDRIINTNNLKLVNKN